MDRPGRGAPGAAVVVTVFMVVMAAAHLCGGGALYCSLPHGCGGKEKHSTPARSTPTQRLSTDEVIKVTFFHFVLNNGRARTLRYTEQEHVPDSATVADH